MWRTISKLILVLCLLFVTACNGETATESPEGTGIPEEVESMFWATISEISGNVMARKPPEPDFSEAVDGAIIQPYGEVMTTENSRARLDLSSGAIIRVSANSIFSLQPIEKQADGLIQNIKLELGRVWVILNGGTMEVETPSGVASVRGSYISVSYDPDTQTVIITCLEGTCTLGNEEGSVTLTAGETAMITGIGEAPVVGFMDDDDFNAWLESVPESIPLILTPPPPTEPVATEPAVTEPPPTELPATEPPVIIPIVPAHPGTGSKPKPPADEPPATEPPATESPPALLNPSVVIASVSPTSSVTGQPVSVSVNIIPPAGGIAPSGKVQVKANGALVCSATLGAAGSATCSGGIFVATTQDLVAYYLGDANYNPAQSAAWTINVGKANTTTTIQAQSMNPSAIGLAVTFTATVDNVPPGAGLPKGSVTFDAVGEVASESCVANSAPWSCDITFTTPDFYTVTATYSGDANFTASVSSAVLQDVWPTANTQFFNPIGPDVPFYMEVNTQCPQDYSVQALDVHGVTEVSVEYSLNDTFATTNHIILSKSGVDTWDDTIVLPTASGGTVYWRFVGVDGQGNKTFFGAGVPYTNGYPGTSVSAYSFGSVICP